VIEKQVGPAESQILHDVFKVTRAVQVDPGKYSSGGSRHRQFDSLSTIGALFGQYKGQPFFNERGKRTAFLGGSLLRAAQKFIM